MAEVKDADYLSEVCHIVNSKTGTQAQSPFSSTNSIRNSSGRCFHI